MNSICFKKGFTLLEAMIALSIFAIVGMVCLETYLVSIKNVQLMSLDKKHVLLARWKIEELRMDASDIEEGESGIFPQPFEDYEWEILLSDLSISETGYNVAFVPYSVRILRGNEEYVSLTPFVKILAGELE